jgi:tetratricopeptide (TPR) repeat protein
MNQGRSISRLKQCALVAVVLFVAACSEPADDPVPAPAVPPGYEQLEPAVRSQFVALMSDWRRAATAENRSEDALGAAWGALGQWLHVYRFQASAITAYSEAARLDADEPRWPYYLGILLMEEGRLDQAESAFRSSLARADRHPAPSVALADLLLQTQRIEEATGIYLQILATDPGHLPSRVALARLALQEADPGGVVERLQSISEDAGPYQRDVDYLLGQAYRRLGRPEQARVHLERFQGSSRRPGAAVRDNPWMRELGALDISANNLSRLGQAAYRQGRFVEAARHSGRAARYNPDDPEILANYASALMALRRFADAREQIERALALDDGLGRAHMIHGKLLLEFGERKAAEDALARAIRIDPDLKDARRVLGRLLHRRGEIELAIEQYAELRARSRSLDQARFWHAALLFVDGRTEAALRALDDDLAIHPDHRELALLQARLSMSDPDRARAIVAGVSSDDGEMSLFELETRAMVAAAQGRFAEAVGLQERAVEVSESADSRVMRRTSGDIARRRLTLYREGRPCLAPWELREVLVVEETSPWSSTAEGRSE